MTPITTDDVWDVFNLLENAATLEDIGITGLRWWRIRANCGRHGNLVRYEETTGEPPARTHMECPACSKEGITRTCAIGELEVITGRNLPILGGI